MATEVKERAAKIKFFPKIISGLTNADQLVHASSYAFAWAIGWNVRERGKASDAETLVRTG